MRQADFDREDIIQYFDNLRDYDCFCNLSNDAELLQHFEQNFKSMPGKYSFAKLACLSTIQQSVKAIYDEFQRDSDKESAECYEWEPFFFHDFPALMHYYLTCDIQSDVISELYRKDPQGCSLSRGSEEEDNMKSFDGYLAEVLSKCRTHWNDGISSVASDFETAMWKINGRAVHPDVSLLIKKNVQSLPSRNSARNSIG
jgi:hypothetical protein